jgi:hypothetical protein
MKPPNFYFFGNRFYAIVEFNFPAARSSGLSDCRRAEQSLLTFWRIARSERQRDFS